LSDTYVQLKRDVTSKPPTRRYLNNDEWRQIYNTQHVFENGDLYLILDAYAFLSLQRSVQLSVLPYGNVELNGTLDAVQKIMSPVGDGWGQWIDFSSLPGQDPSLRNASDPKWQTWPWAAHVEIGISKIIKPKSRLQISLSFMLVVIFFNLLKLCVMSWVLYTDRTAYLVTLGDAVSSFLEAPDLTTGHLCMLGKEEMLYKLGYMPYLAPGSEDELETLVLRSQGVWLPVRREYFFVLSRDRQIFFGLV
jgi:hypothetical protein